MLKIINLEATTLEDAWFQALYNIADHGRKFKIDKGSYENQYRLEFDYINILIKKPEIRPLLPKIPNQYNIPDPVTEEYLNNYITYLMTDIKHNNEDYTYGERIVLQLDKIINTYKNHGYRNNQMILQIGQPLDIDLVDPPCLRQIDTRIQDGYLHFYIYFRSWDLFNGFPANLAGIQILKEYMCELIGNDIKPGVSYVSSKGLHVYDYVFEIVDILRGKKK